MDIDPHYVMSIDQVWCDKDGFRAAECSSVGVDAVRYEAAVLVAAINA